MLGQLRDCLNSQLVDSRMLINLTQGKVTLNEEMTQFNISKGDYTINDKITISSYACELLTTLYGKLEYPLKGNSVFSEHSPT